MDNPQILEELNQRRRHADPDTAEFLARVHAEMTLAQKIIRALGRYANQLEREAEHV
jgi:hypothetical protein